jgi:hypothetical protein
MEEGHLSNFGVFILLSLVHIIEPGYELEDPSHDMRQLGFLQPLQHPTMYFT